MSGSCGFDDVSGGPPRVLQLPSFRVADSQRPGEGDIGSLPPSPIIVEVIRCAGERRGIPGLGCDRGDAGGGRQPGGAIPPTSNSGAGSGERAGFFYLLPVNYSHPRVFLHVGGPGLPRFPIFFAQQVKVDTAYRLKLTLLFSPPLITEFWPTEGSCHLQQIMCQLRLYKPHFSTHYAG